MILLPISNSEVFKVVADLGHLKAPGPDGFSGIFFKKYWNVIGRSVCNAVRGFFNGQYLLKEINCINLVLIPMVAAPETLSHFRPISLCNFIYKVIYKTLASRLKPFMDIIISPN